MRKKLDFFFFGKKVLFCVEISFSMKKISGLYFYVLLVNHVFFVWNFFSKFFFVK